MIYLDDGIIVGNDELECRRFSVIVQRDLHRAGWLTTAPKCQWDPQQCLTWLGVIIDCHRFVLLIPADRINSCLEAIQLLLSPGAFITARQVASVTGKLISMSCGPIAQLQTRHYHAVLSRTSWDNAVFITQEAYSKLRFWAENLNRLNFRDLAFLPPAELFVLSDASDTGCGAHVIIDGETHISHRAWTADELRLYSRHSTWCELETVRYCIPSSCAKTHASCL